jgi:protein-tyrosine-phosphatase
MSETTPAVLFVCIHNAGRSQMAAALLDHHAACRVVVRSAGSQPADQLNPAVVEAMAELELDISKEFPKPLTDDAVKASDVVITMGCGDECSSLRAGSLRGEEAWKAAAGEQDAREACEHRESHRPGECG